MFIYCPLLLIPIFLFLGAIKFPLQEGHRIGSDSGRMILVLLRMNTKETTTLMLTTSRRRRIQVEGHRLPPLLLAVLPTAH